MKKKSNKNKEKKISKKKVDKIEEIYKLLGINTENIKENSELRQNDRVKQVDKNIYSQTNNEIKNNNNKIDNIKFDTDIKSNNIAKHSERKLYVIPEEEEEPESSANINSKKKDISNKIEKKKENISEGKENMDDEELKYYLQLLDEFDTQSISLNIPQNDKEDNDQHNNSYSDNSNYSSDKENKDNSNSNENEILNKLSGMADHLYFKNIINNNQGSLEFDVNDFIFRDVLSDGNCGYRALALQLYSNEDNFDTVRKDIYEYLNINKNSFNHLNPQLNGNSISSNEYIKHVSENKFWMGDLELSVVSTLYDAVFYVFDLKDEDNLILLSQYGDINNISKIFLNICYVNDNHYNILYEKNRLDECNLINNKNIINSLTDTINKNKSIKLNLDIDIPYANDNRVIKYKEIVNYLNKKNIRVKVSILNIYI